MMVIHVETNVAADQRQAFLAAIESDIPVSRTFAGCLRYVWSENALEPNQFSLYEEWETQAALEAYKNSEHFQRMGKALFPLFVGHPASRYYEAALF